MDGESDLASPFLSSFVKRGRDRKIMSKEIWKPIPGFENRYEVSNLGRFKSINRKINVFNKAKYNMPDKIFEPHKDCRGYGIITLGDKSYRSHRLVAQQKPLAMSGFLYRKSSIIKLTRIAPLHNSP